MTFLFTVGLVVLGAALLAVGVVSDQSWALYAAAALSAVAVVLLWRVVGRTRDKTFITGAPASTSPEWDRLFRGEFQDEDLDERDEPSRDRLPPVAIDHYEDLVASEIMPSLETLSIEQLEAVIAREQHGLGRPIIISRAEKLIDLTRGSASDLDLREESISSSKSSSSPKEKSSPGATGRAEQEPSPGKGKQRSSRSKRPPKDEDLSLE